MELVSTSRVPVLVAVIILYCLPLLVAYGRQHPRRSRIALYNLLLGWFPPIWVVALVWACHGSSGRATAGKSRSA